jgi:hypothetical protein
MSYLPQVPIMLEPKVTELVLKQLDHFVTRLAFEELKIPPTTRSAIVITVAIAPNY